MSQVAKVNVLLVDDLEDNLRSLSAVLAQPGLELRTTRSGEAALEALLVDGFALALVDVHMPGMNGFDLAELMRGTERTRHIPIIFITADTEEAGRMFKGYEAGAVDFLVKPVDPRLLRSKVDVFVQLYRQKQQLSDQLAQLNQMLHLSDMLIAVLGHDLRSPLQSIDMASHLTLQQAGNPDAVKRYSMTVRKSTLRMRRLIDQLLDFARARTQGGIPVAPAPCGLRELAQSAIAELDPTAAARLELNAYGTLTGTWDADRILQLFTNLICNATVHGAPGGPVHVELDGSAPDRVRIEVHNRGHIPADQVASLFDPFTRPRDRSRRTAGLGLGLYIVDQIVQAHRGQLAVSSDPSTGTRFI